MVYAFDEVAQIPTMDLYDTQMMLASILTAKDLYEKREERIKDFRKEYGNFMTPFTKDMSRYKKIVDGVTNTINNLYANGMDPLRDAQGGAIMMQALNNLDPAEMSNLRTNAKLGFEYLSEIEKARANDQFDEDYENWLLRKENGGPGAFDDFSSAGGKIWTRPAPGRLEDLNKWTHHLFDNMELSYDPELSKQYPGFMAYTKSRDTMNQIVDNNIAELLNSNIGKYRLWLIENEIPENYRGNRRAAAINELKKRVVDANWEEGQVKLETDPYAYLKMQAALRPRSGSGGGSGKAPSGKSEYNYLTGVFTRGISIPYGYNPDTQGEEALNNIVKNQVAFGQSTIPEGNPAIGAWQAYKSKSIPYVNKFTTYEAPDMFSFSIGRPIMNKMGGVYMTYDDVSRLHTTEDVVTNTYGYPNATINTNRKNIPSPLTKVNDTTNPDETLTSNIIMLPYRDVYTAYRKNTKSIESQWKIKLINSETGDSYGDYWYDLPIGTEPNIDMPRIDEWTVGATGNIYAPKDNKGNERGQAKASINPKWGGAYERSSQLTNKALGVTKHIYSGNIPYTLESISL